MKEVLTAAQIRPDGNVDHEIVTLNQTTRNDPASWSHAKAQFPELISVSPDVLKAVTLNELFSNQQDTCQQQNSGVWHILLKMSQTAAYIARKAENAAYISQIFPPFEQYMPHLKTAANAQ